MTTPFSLLSPPYSHSMHFLPPDHPQPHHFHPNSCPPLPSQMQPPGCFFITPATAHAHDSPSVTPPSDHAAHHALPNTLPADDGLHSNNITVAIPAPPPPVTAQSLPVPDKPAAGMSLTGSSIRTSIYRGVTRHRWTGRYEAHLWDNTCKRQGQKRKGRQVYLGGYDKEEKAARAYDLAAIKYWGIGAVTNFPIDHYAREIEEMQNMTKQEFVASIRRKSSGFSRGASIYRGVTRHHQHGRWQARIGRVAGNKDLYLGTFASEEEAAEAYDVAAIKFRGNNAVTNFELSRYDLDAIASSDLPIGPSGRKSKVAAEPPANNSTQISFDRSSLATPNSTAVPPAFFRNFLQLSASELMVSFPPMLTFRDNGAVPVSQGFFSFPDGYEQKGHQPNTLPMGTGLLQLANVSVSMSP